MLFNLSLCSILVGFDYERKAFAAVAEKRLPSQLKGIVPQVFEHLFCKALCIVQIIVRGEVYAKAFVIRTAEAGIDGVHFFVDGLGECTPADFAVWEMFIDVSGFEVEFIGNVLHLPTALEGGVHGEYVLVGGVHGGDDGEVGGKFNRRVSYYIYCYSLVFR